MNKAETRSILHAELLKYRAKSYPDLLYLLECQDCSEVKGPSGVLYQFEIQALWDAKPNDILRVQGSIDDRGLRAFFALTEDFLMTPVGQLIGE
jgi:hypothetical protein